MLACALVSITLFDTFLFRSNSSFFSELVAWSFVLGPYVAGLTIAVGVLGWWLRPGSRREIQVALSVSALTGLIGLLLLFNYFFG